MKTRFFGVSSLLLALSVNFTIAQELNLESGQRRAHETPWTYLTVSEEAGTLVTNAHSYTELATGLNRWDGSANAWVAADPSFEIIDGKAVSRRAQHQLVLSANVNDAAGALELWTPTGAKLRMQCIGIAVTDPITGVSGFIAEIKD